MNNPNLTRREFIKLGAAGLSSLSLRPMDRLLGLPEFPNADKLGRVCVGKVELKSRPDSNSITTGILYEDSVVPWLKEVTGERPYYIYSNQRWVETPQGYIYSPYVQPVYYRPNSLVSNLNEASFGAGMWAEVTVPYVDAILEKDPSSNSWVKVKMDEGLPLRFYYSQIFWVDQIKIDEQNRTLYRVNPNYYGGVDKLWADAQAFRPLTDEDLAPIHTDVTNKKLVVDVNSQVLSCFEGNSEIFYCRVSTGAKFNNQGERVDEWATPVGTHRVTRKYISLQMSGGTTGAGYDLPGIGYSAIFAIGGVAVHSTFWHNNFGDPVSHGCVNTRPEDAKWVFRWMMPAVIYDPGKLDVTISGEDSTEVTVIEG